MNRMTYISWMVICGVLPDYLNPASMIDFTKGRKNEGIARRIVRSNHETNIQAAFNFRMGMETMVESNLGGHSKETPQ